MVSKIKTLIPEFIKSDGFKKFLRFSIVGGTTFIINTFLQWFVRRILLYENFTSIAIVFLFVALCHFLMNNFFAFKDSNALYKRRIIGYALFLVISTLLNSVLLYSFLTFVLDNVLIATTSVTAVMMLVNFTILNKLVFKQSEESQ